MFVCHTACLLGIPIRSLLSDEDCGVLKEPLRFGAETCENRLPFICMKNDKDSESTGQILPSCSAFLLFSLTFTANISLPLLSAVREVYKPTVCKDGWTGWKGFCYKLHSKRESKLSQHEALSMCRMDGSDLASMHSLEDIEMLHTNFHSGKHTGINNTCSVKAC